MVDEFELITSFFLNLLRWPYGVCFFNLQLSKLYCYLLMVQLMTSLSSWGKHSLAIFVFNVTSITLLQLVSWEFIHNRYIYISDTELSLFFFQWLSFLAWSQGSIAVASAQSPTHCRLLFLGLSKRGFLFLEGDKSAYEDIWIWWSNLWLKFLIQSQFL